MDLPTISARSLRENSRVRTYVYTFSGISFVLAILEGLPRGTSLTLITHLLLSLSFLAIVPIADRKPLAIMVLCLLMQGTVWSTMMLLSADHTGWLGVKIPAIIVALVAVRNAWRIEKPSTRF